MAAGSPRKSGIAKKCHKSLMKGFGFWTAVSHDLTGARAVSKTPDLQNLRYSRYIDATAKLHNLADLNFPFADDTLEIG